MDNWNSGGYSFETDRSISDEDDEMAASGLSRCRRPCRRRSPEIRCSRSLRP